MNLSCSKVRFVFANHIGLIFLILLVTNFSFADPCQKTRGIIDIGSGSTKAKVAVVDICTQKIVSVLMEEQTKKVGYAADLKEQKLKNQNTFSKNIQTEGEKAIRELIALGNQQIGEIEWRGFATSAFRVSENGEEVLSTLSKNTGVRLALIDQDKEGQLGFAAGIQVSKRPNAKRTLVWDIGNGSQQFSYIQNGKIKTVKLENQASESFKGLLIQKVKGINDNSIRTPNPIGLQNISASKALAIEIAKKIALSFHPKEVIGIGGVHSKSIINAIGQKNSYTAEDIDAALPSLVVKNDEELKDKYADTLVSNALLVSGFMNALHFKRVIISQHSTADGALVLPDFWK